MRGLVAVILLAFVFRLALFFLLRPTLGRISKAYGINITFDRQELTLLGGDVGLWGLKITPKNSSEPLLVCDYVRGHVSPTDLIMAQLHVLRAEADGVELTLDRTSDGRIPLLDTLAAATSKPSPAGAAAGCQSRRAGQTPGLHVAARDRSVPVESCARQGARRVRLASPGSNRGHERARQRPGKQKSRGAF
jgi:hypothetical protein